jgi:protein SCO1/2
MTRIAPFRIAPRSALGLAVLAALAHGLAAAQTAEQVRRGESGVAVEERLGAAVPLDGAFRDDEGRPVSLREMAGRPLLLSFNYTSCPKLCSLQLAGVARMLRDMGWKGERLSVVTVSIDPDEQLPQLRRFKETYVGQAGGHPGAAAAWHFLAGSQADVDALAEAVGFRYRYDPRTGEFVHKATLVVLTPDGRVSGYLHGIAYPPESVRAALDRAEGGRVATVEEQASLGGFLLTCIGFDPDDPTPLGLKVMRAGGVAVALFLFAFLGVQLLRGHRLRRSRSSP